MCLLREFFYRRGKKVQATTISQFSMQNAKTIDKLRKYFIVCRRRAATVVVRVILATIVCWSAESGDEARERKVEKASTSVWIYGKRHSYIQIISKLSCLQLHLWVNKNAGKMYSNYHYNFKTCYEQTGKLGESGEEFSQVFFWYREIFRNTLKVEM